MTMNLNGTTGIVLPTAAAPAFSAYQSSGQAIGTATYTKVQFQTEEFDTNNNFDNATNYRFTPTVAGYYLVTGQVLLLNSTTTETIVNVFKNGAAFKVLSDIVVPLSRNTGGSALIYLNGSTDYIELWFYTSVAGTLSTGNTVTYFQAFLARSA